MDIGLPVPNITLPSGAAAIEAVSRAADELGYHSVWLGDHIVRPIGPDEHDHFKGRDRYTWDLYEPMVTAGFVAAITQHVKIGFGVLVLPYRNPVVTAKMVASLDQLSNGRVILGVGAGYWPQEFRALGIERRDTGAKTTEYIEMFRTVWSNERPEFHGEFVELEHVLFKPSPMQNHLPIWVGGMSQGAIDRAVSHGDGWHLPRFTPESLVPLVRKLRASAERMEVDLADFVISNRPAVRIADEPVRREQQEYKPGDPAPPAAPIIGPPGYLIEELARFTEVGVSHLVIDLHEGDPLPAVLEAAQCFAEDVMPGLQQ